MDDTMDPWSHEARVARAKAEVEAAYLLLAPFLNTHYLGTPTKEDLRSLLSSAYRRRSAMQEAIACAEAHFPEVNK